MRITFICGCLEPGEDGVGDYTRKLAEQLNLTGHDCQLIAINDHTDHQETKDSLQTLRFINLLNNPEQSAAAHAAIDTFNPNWVSLQFVCFSFHPKGFTHKLLPFIRNSRKSKRRLHIMFHELWVGEQPSLPLRHKLLGNIQRYQILKALKQWQADVIHTSNSLYQRILQHHSHHATILPLFSNVSITEQAEQQASSGLYENQRTLLFPFSQRHDWNVTETLKQLEKLSGKAGVSLRLIQIGKLRSGDQHWPQIQSFCAARNWHCELLGPQDEVTLSEHMHRADIGISSAHIALAGKSGAVAAMVEHGLPVICTITESISKRFTPEPSSSEQLYSFFDSEERLLDLLRQPQKSPPSQQLPQTADQFIQELNQLT